MSVHTIWTIDQWADLDGYLRATKEMCAAAVERVKSDLVLGFIYMTWVQPVNMTAYSGLEVTLKSLLRNGLGVGTAPKKWGHKLTRLIREVEARKPEIVRVLDEAYGLWTDAVPDLHPDAHFLHDDTTFPAFIEKLEGYFDAFRYWPLEKNAYRKLRDRPVDPRLLVELWDALFQSCETMDKGGTPGIPEWRRYNIIRTGLTLLPPFPLTDLESGTPVSDQMRRYNSELADYEAKGSPSAFEKAIRIKADLEELSSRSI